MQIALPLLLVAATAPLSPSIAVPARSAVTVRADETPDIKAATDRSVRWLRSKQDPVTGAYGGSLEPTAWTLIALARCPRHYAPHDGPFVRRALDYLLALRSDAGAVHDADASDEEQAAQTRLAAIAFAHHPTPETTRALAAAVEWLEARGVETGEATDPTRNPELADLTREEALAFAVRALARCDANGAWSGEGPGDGAGIGAIQATARAVVDLSTCYARLASPKSPRPVTALPKGDVVDAAAIDRAILAGARFLLGAAQDGLWGGGGQPDAGITAMVLAALQSVAEPRPEDVQQAIDRGLGWLADLQREDGSIHDGKLDNYITSASILALARAGDRYRDEIVAARQFLVGLQSDQGEGYSPEHHYYGGVGYGGDERPDLSNLQMALEALSASGLESDHAAYQRALTFLQRCQNRSESNDLALDDGAGLLVAGDDGGAAYAPGSSPAGFIELEDGKKVARSYGSMSYALLKSYIFAGLERDDPRVEALWKWLQDHYTLDVNPGFEYVDDPAAAYQGLFYYFNTMARALDLYGADELTDRHGVRHDWRAELAARLIAMQSRIDGSWKNDNASRWWEGNPVLATAYALTTLELTRPR